MTASLSQTNWPPPIGVRGDTTIIESFALPLGDGLVLCHPGQDRLAVLNATGKAVWDLLRAGLAREEIASVFARHFGLSFDRACADVATAIAGIEGAPLAEFDPPKGRDAPSIPGSRDPLADHPTADCGGAQK
jgi:Coenzyme PQQ synthesis protein D (PqqD)